MPLITVSSYNPPIHLRSRHLQIILPLKVRKIRTFKEFDDRFTAPLNGFANAEDYRARCSSLPRLHAISIPTLILNALDDPILTPQCFPYDLARNHPSVFPESPRYGGHVGFIGKSCSGNYWHEDRTLQFCETGAPAL